MIDHTDLETIVNLVVSIRPRPALVTRAQAAEMLGLSEPTVRKLIRLKKIMLSEDGKIPISEIDRLILVRRAA